MKKPLTGAAIIAIATVFFAQPGYCIEQIEEWQKYIKQEETGGPKYAENVAGATICLAEQYQRYGMIKQADETFEKAIHLYRNLPVSPEKQRFVAIYISWARTILKGRLPSRSRDGRELRYQAPEHTKEDFPRVNAALRKAWSELTSCEAPYHLNSSNFFYVVQMFYETGNVMEAKRCEKYLLSACEKIEKSKAQTTQQIKWAAEILTGLCFAIYPESRSIPRREEIEMMVSEMNANSKVPSASTKQYSLTSAEFWKLPATQRAEIMRLKALALLDGSNSDQKARIEAHRYMALWYLNIGRFQNAVQQTRILADIIGSKDTSMLFPIPQECNGRCGMG